MSEQIKNIEETIKKLESKDFGLYFFTLDTKGNPVAGIANIYEHVKVLNELGYKAHILHEDETYKLHGDAEGMGIADWLGEEYAKLPHVSIKDQTLKIGPQDSIFIPEVFANMMEKVQAFPCKKVVFCQAHEYALELLGAGRRWTDFGFTDVITTSDRQANYIKQLFPTIQSHTVPVGIPEYFKPNDLPKQPIISIVARNQTDAGKVAKHFYLQYPMYQFVTFEDLRGLPREKFAERVKNSCLAIWIDDLAGFGTFPLEAIECNTPIIGKIPNTVPEWMEESSDNGVSKLKAHGIWTNTTTNIAELIATYLKVWFEDSVPADLLKSMDDSKGGYSMDKQKVKIEEVYTELFTKRVEEFNNAKKALQEQLDQAKVAETETK